MEFKKNRDFGQVISRIINKENLSQRESYDAFGKVLNNEVSEMQQGGFLAALTAKEQTAEEVAGGWQAVYDLDTNKVDLQDLPVVDNCGTGMDSFKTFNISTAASLVAAAGGTIIGRHGARAISSSCGTVDIVEALGVDMECPVDIVEKSIRETNIGLFNGMSPMVHPMALGRILSQIHFGSPLNIAASLAHPALPKIAVRGVYSPTLLQPVAEVMKTIGYSDALVVYGAIDGSSQGMDEGSVCGETYICHFTGNEVKSFTVSPEEVGLKNHDCRSLAADTTLAEAARNMVDLLAGEGDEPRNDAVIFNSALIFYVEKRVSTLKDGVEMARELLRSGTALETLKRWVEVQNQNPEQGLEQFCSKLAGEEVTLS